MTLFSTRVMAPLRRHALPLATALLLQTAIQFVAAVGGILLVRWLDTNQYAYYAIVNAAVVAATAISNSGVFDGLTALAARHGTDANGLGRIVATALGVRRSIATLVAVAVLPSQALLLWWNGATFIEIVPLSALLAALLWIELHYAIQTVVPWLRGAGRRIQRIELDGAMVRLGGIVVLASLIPRADIAIGCWVLGLGAQLYLLHRRHLVFASGELPDAGFRREILVIVRRQWPNEIGSLLQSQAGLWLLTAVAGTESIAVYAALGRVGALFTLILVALHRTIIAQYAMAQEPRTIVRRYLQTVLAFLCLGLGVLLFVAVFPNWILALLGGRYAGDAYLLKLSAISGLAGALATLTLWLNVSRGWIIPAHFSLPYQLIGLLGLTLWFGGRSVEAVLLITAGVGLLQTVANVVYFRRCLESATSLVAPIRASGS